MDIATLGIELNTSKLKEGSRDLDQSQVAARKAAEQMERLKEQAEKSFESVKRAGEIVKRTLEGIGVTLAAKEIVDATIENEQSQVRLEAIMKTTGNTSQFLKGQLDQLAESMQKNTQFSDDAAREAESTLLVYDKIGGKIFPQVLKSSADLATYWKTDLQSASTLLARTLQDPDSNLQLLNRSLRIFTQEQVASITKMSEMGNVAGAQAAILAQLDSKVGGLAERMRNTLGGALSVLKNTFGDILEAKPGEGLDSLRNSVEDLIKVFQDPAVVTGLKLIVGGTLELISLAAQAVGVIAGYVGALRNAGIAAAEAAEKSESSGIRFRDAWEVTALESKEFLTAFADEAVMAMIKIPIGLVAAIKVVSVSIAALVDDTINVLSLIGNRIGEVFENALVGARGIFSSFASWLADKLQAFADFTDTVPLFDGLTDKLTSGAAALRGFAKDQAESAAVNRNAAAELVAGQDAAGQAIDATSQSLSESINFIADDVVAQTNAAEAAFYGGKAHKELAKEIDKVNTTRKEGKADTNQATLDMMKLNEQLEKEVGWLLKGADAEQARARAIAETKHIAPDVERDNEALNNQLKALRDVANYFNAGAQAAERYLGQIDSLEKEVSKGTITQEQATQAADYFATQLTAQTVGSIDPAKEALTQLGFQLNLIQQMSAKGLDKKLADDMSAIAKFKAQEIIDQGKLDKLNDSFARLVDGASAFGDKFAQSVKTVTSGISSISSGQDKLHQAELVRNTDRDKYNQLVAEGTADQLSGYANLAQGAAGFFEEGSTGYRTMMAISQAFHIAELAATLAELIPKGIAAVLNQANGDPYTAFGRMAAMAAIVAGLGVAIGGAFGSSGGSKKPDFDPKKVGTGSVLGDAEAQSESASKALAQLVDIQSQGLNYSRSMLQSLHAVDDGIERLSNSILRQFSSALQGSKNGDDFGLPTEINFPQQTVGQALGKQPGGQPLATSQLDISGISNFLGFQSMFQGILTAIHGGVDPTKPQALSEDEFQKPIRSIIEGFLNSASDAIKLLGGDADAATQAILDLDLGLDNLSDLSKLSGDELDKALQALFSKLGDRIATAVLPAIAEFQHSGEGLFETLVRVSSETHAVVGELANLGVSFGAITGLDLARAAEGLIDAAGGFDVLNSSIATFYDKFYTDKEKIKNATDNLNQILGELGAGTLPATRDGFRQLVEGLDLTTETGQHLFAVLTGLAGDADAIYSDLEDSAKKAAEAEMALHDSMIDFATGAQQMIAGIQGVGNEFSAAIAAVNLETAQTFDERAAAGNELLGVIQANYNAESKSIEDSRKTRIDAINDALKADLGRINAAAKLQDDRNKAIQSANQKNIEIQNKAAELAAQAYQKQKDIAQGLLEFVAKLKGSALDLGSPIDRLASNLQRFRDLSKQAQGGNVEAAAQLSEVGQQVVDLAREVHGSTGQFRDIFGEVTDQTTKAATNLIEKKPAPELLVLRQVSAASIVTNDLLNKQIETAQKNAQKQIDEINKNADDELSKLKQTTIDKINELTKAVLTGNVTENGILKAITDGNAKSIASMAAMIAAIKGIHLDPLSAIPHAAAGTITRGPTLAGEAGPEAVIPLPNGRVPVAFLGGNTAGMKELIAELRAQRAALEQSMAQGGDIVIMTADERELARYTMKELKERSRKGKAVVYVDGTRIGRAKR